ncbi:MAG: V-type ATP synthase subunit A, partial [candidate division WOR-3 bacterium]
MSTGRVYKVSGPLVVAEGMAGSKIYDVVRVSESRLIGEIVRVDGDRAAIQVYEETAGIGVGEPVYPSYEPLSVELGPGLIGSIYDGIQRPLDALAVLSGDFIVRGVEAAALDRNRLWKFVPRRRKGEFVRGGDSLGVVQETPLVEHHVMVPPAVEGEIVDISEQEVTVDTPIAYLRTATGEQPVKMVQRWPVRQPRPVRRRLTPDSLLVTGQRVIDTFFPLAKGGTGCVPGPFGSGKTVIQHQLAKWCEADIIVFVGCGERGNEMTDVLQEFPELKDPKTGEPLMKRTVLVANTSNMPVAAREASVYTAMTIAEYYRDMGYSVALQADSTSRWAEAMREMSGRLEEMPGEEGYPAYLAARVAEFYERAGRVVCLGTHPGEGETEGSLTVIGAVSPPGGDLNDPVVQATLRAVKVFWSLEDRLAFQRHFPAISWLNSYSLYRDELSADLQKRAGEDFSGWSRKALEILRREAELIEVVRLVGQDALAPSDRLLLMTGRSLREDFLHQNAFHPEDTWTSLPKQAGMLGLILEFHRLAELALQRGATVEKISTLPCRQELGRVRYVPERDFARH